MKVRISYIVDADDELRRQINAWYGRPGLADREEIKRWYEANGSSMDADLSETRDRPGEGRDAWGDA